MCLWRTERGVPDFETGETYEGVVAWRRSSSGQWVQHAHLNLAFYGDLQNRLRTNASHRPRMHSSGLAVGGKPPAPPALRCVSCEPREEHWISKRVMPTRGRGSGRAAQACGTKHSVLVRVLLQNNRDDDDPHRTEQDVARQIPELAKFAVNTYSRGPRWRTQSRNLCSLPQQSSADFSTL